MEEYEFDLEELEPTKPYTAEQQAVIDEINYEIAEAFAEYCALCNRGDET